MIDPFRHMTSRQRVALAIWIVNVTLFLAVLVFVLR